MHDTTHTSTTRTTLPSDPVRVGVLSLHSSKETKAICNAVAALGHDPVWLGDGNLSVHVGADGVTVTPDVDVVANRLLCSKAETPLDDLGMAAAIACDVPLLNRPEAVATASHKIESLARLAARDVPVPESVLETSRARLPARRAAMGEDVVQKPVVGTNGQGMARLGEADVAAPRSRGGRSYLQEFVDTGASASHGPATDGGEAVAVRPETGGAEATAESPAQAWDLRVYVVDDQVVGTMRRSAADGDWRANVARGGDVVGVDPDPAVAALAISATNAMGLDYAGVDVISRAGSDDREWVVVEVNPTAGFRGLHAATGVSPAPYIAAAALRRVGYEPDPARVKELATDLDDSDPPCDRPNADVDDGADEGPVTVELSQEVAVGTDGATTTVQAKSDTGAKRTSVGYDLAARLNAGPIVGTMRVKSGGNGPSKPRPLVELDVRIAGEWRTVEATMADRSRMSHELLLGRDALAGLQVVVADGDDSEE
jgi:glutathione synthase/RimK-type ligase-like ATP-grasp enzyme